MLRLRVLTALIAAPGVLAAIFLLPTSPFAVVFLALAAIGLFEWSRLAGLQSMAWQVAYIATYAACGYALLQAPAWWHAILTGVVGFWVLAALVVVSFPASTAVLVRSVLVPAGYVVFIGAWLALVVLAGSDSGRWVIVWVFAVVWGADIGAYFVGRWLGRHKLAVHVSPGKTWEGAIAGVMSSALIGTAIGAFAPPLTALAYDSWHWAGAAIVVAIVSVFGDLFESAVKRVRGVKDSGSLFPGHGGMLDRVDSLVAALPCVALALSQQP